jgi:hypothetical protein
MSETHVYLTARELLVLRLGLVALNPDKKTPVDTKLDAKLAEALRNMKGTILD